VVSQQAAAVLGARPGVQLTAVDGDPSQGGVRAPLTVVGIYAPVDAASPYWSLRGQGSVQTRPTAEDQAARVVPDLYTPWATLGAHPWQQLATHLDIPLIPSRVDATTIDEISGATSAVNTQARTVDGAGATSDLAGLVRSAKRQTHDARVVIPLLAVQLAVLGIVVLAFVCAAATEQRRPEIALARLRGHGTLGAATMLLRELGLLVVVGAVLGTGLGWLAAEVATRLWLEPGVHPEWSSSVALAVLASVAAGLLAILAAATPTLRQPLTSLLRRVPPRASALQVGLVEGAVVAAAAAGVVTLLSGNGGPVALLAPGLLAIAGGLLLAQLTIPTAGPLARRNLRRGRVPSALAALQIARRPALRRLIAIVTVACALLVFAVDAWTVADRNRTSRAAVEAGAPVVLTVDATSSLALRQAVLAIDPHGRFATPVVTVSSATPVGPRTTAVEPRAFARIASWGNTQGRPSRAALQALTAPLPPPVIVRGTALRVVADFNPRPGQRPIPGQPQLDLGAMRLRLGLGDHEGVVHPVDLGVLKDGRGTYTGTMNCPSGCRLEQVEVDRTFGSFGEALVGLQVRSLAAGTPGALAPVDLDTATKDNWQPRPFDLNNPGGDVVRPGKTLSFVGDSFGTPVIAQRGDKPVSPVAIRTGGLTPLPVNPFIEGARVSAPDLAAGDSAFNVAGHLPQVPRAGGRGVLVDLGATATGPSISPALSSYAVWLASDDPAKEAVLRHQLARHGLHILGRDSASAHASALASEGPSLALRLALLAGAVAVILAAAVLVVGVATSGASRARDLAGLRIVGVPATTVTRASVREHLVVAILGVVAGSILGLLAAQAALPQIPLFATRNRFLPLVLDPAWTPVAVTIIGCLLLLGAVSVVVGRSLAASAVPDRLREAR
jgi:hypothetical protein